MIFLQFIHLLSLAVWIGSIVFFSFVAAPAIFKTLPRETAGDVVGRIFPQYYKLGYVCGIFALGTLPLISSGAMERAICLVLMTVVTFYSAFMMGPKIRRLKNELRETTENIEQKKRQFSKLHGISMGLNMLVLATGLILLFLTAAQFRP